MTNTHLNLQANLYSKLQIKKKKNMENINLLGFYTLDA